jgi:DNA-binding NarL/FixJ family response regulator
MASLPGLTLARAAWNQGLALWPCRGGQWHDAAMALTVLIVDDHPTFRSLARDLLESEGFRVVGESEDGATAIRAASLLRPDVVLLDIQLPDLTGFEVTERLMSGHVPTAVVLVSSRDASDYGPDVESSGAMGFLQKSELCGAAVRALLKGAA